MQGPFHEFILLPETGAHATQSQHQVGLEHPLRLPHDLIWYLHDSLQWVESENPAKHCELGQGLNLYGPTGFAGSGAALLGRILRAWAMLFSCGPPALSLRGGIDDRGEFCRDEFCRDEIVELLNAIAEAAERASHEGHWLLHLGV